MSWVAAVTVACAWAASRLGRRWFPGGPWSRRVVVVTVLTVTLLTSIGQVAGALGVLAGWSVLAGAAIVAAVGWFAGEGRPRDGDDPGPPQVPVPPLQLAVLAAGVTATAAQWAGHVGEAYARGMVQFDNLWYHGSFLARIVQTGGFGSFGELGYAQSRYYPLNTHLLSAMLALPTGTDVFVPLLNLAFAAVALVAAWEIGRRHGAPVPTTLAALVLLTLPLLSSTQPGQMYNDIAACSFLLAAAALLDLDADADSRGSVLVLLALGWALSVKLSIVVSVAVLAAVALATLIRRREWRVVATGTAAFAVTGGFWFVRNLVLAGSPMPYADLRIGPIGFAPESEVRGDTLVGSLGQLDLYGRFYLDSLVESLGALWPAVVVAAVVGPIVLVVRGTAATRALGGAALAGLVTYPFTPWTGGVSFVHNLRYASGALLLGLVAAALAASRRRVGQRAAIVSSVVLMGVGFAAVQDGPVPNWSDQPRWTVAGAVVGAVAATAPWWWPRVRDALGDAVRPAVLAVAVLAAVAGTAAMPRLEARYLERRYVASGLPEQALYEAAATDEPTRVDAFGLAESYGLFGPHLDNEVVPWNERLDEVDGPASCRVVRGWLSSPLGDEDGEGLIVVGIWVERPIRADERAAWFEQDPAVTLEYSDRHYQVYRRTGPLDPSACTD